MYFFRLILVIITALITMSTALPTEKYAISNRTVTKHRIINRNDAMGNPSITATNDTMANHTATDQEFLDFDDEFGLGFPAEQREALVAAYGDLEHGTGLVKRLAPRDRKLSEQMKTLPECYQTCFKNENGKVGVNIYEWDLKRYCGSGWTRVCLWVDYHIRPCWRWQCRNVKDKIAGQAREWTRDTCGF